MTPEELTALLIAAKKERQAAWDAVGAANEAKNVAAERFQTAAKTVNEIADQFHKATDEAAGVTNDDGKGGKK